LPALRLRDSDGVKGAANPAHRLSDRGSARSLSSHASRHGLAITPIAIPRARSDLNPNVIRRLSAVSFSVFSSTRRRTLATAASPIYDPVSAEVLGIVNMVFVKGTKETALTQPSGITYAIPANRARSAAKVSPDRSVLAQGVLKALVLPPTGSLLVAALGLGGPPLPPRGPGARVRRHRSLFLLCLPAVSDVLRQASADRLCSTSTARKAHRPCDWAEARAAAPEQRRHARPSTLERVRYGAASPG
jgi:hypothetical protein